jgi:putative FmdB family regulatory protein
MPIYEFYCADCHTVFNFFSRRIDTEKKPRCPRCGRPDLERWLSVFAISKGRKQGDDVLDGIDEDKMERAMAAMASEMEGVDENDPRQAARLMRRLFDAAGVDVGGGMEEAMRRMEAGEDPEKIEEEMGQALEEENPFSEKTKATAASLKALRRDLLPPKRDKTLYDL